MITKNFLARIVKSIRNESPLSEVLTMDVLKLNFNYTDGSAVEPQMYIMPLHVQLTWICLFLIVALVGTIGNITVIWIVLAHKSMRTTANLFIVNLAIADALSSILNVPFSTYTELFVNWPFGEFYCKFNGGIASVCVCVSVITMAVLSIERYNVIITPFKPRLYRRTAILIILLIWTLSIVVTIPHWYFIEVQQVVYRDGEATLCEFVWSRLDYGELWLSIYSTFFMLLTYVLPLACMSFTYGRVGMHLWRPASIGEETESHFKQRQAKQKVVKMMIVVVIVFAVCWMPMHLYYIFMASNWKDSPFLNNLYLVLYLLAMSNSMYNPIIYCWMNDKFRAGFKEVFRCCLCQFNGAEYNQTAVIM